MHLTTLILFLFLMCVLTVVTVIVDSHILGPSDNTSLNKKVICFDFL